MGFNGVFIARTCFRNESVIETVLVAIVIERIFGQKLRDSGKYFACFLVIRFFSIFFHIYQLITLAQIIASSYDGQTQKVFVGTYGMQSFWMNKNKCKVAVFSPLV